MEGWVVVSGAIAKVDVGLVFEMDGGDGGRSLGVDHFHGCGVDGGLKCGDC